MALATLTLSPQHSHLNVEAGSYASAETRLDFGCFLDDGGRIVDERGEALNDASWSALIFDGSGSVHAESFAHGIGSIRYRPPSPNGVPGGCVVQADLSSAGFASLLAVCLAGRLPDLRVTVDGLEDDGTGTLVWNREGNSFLVITSLSTDTYLPVAEAPAEAADD